jgi:hypothetical protein
MALCTHTLLLHCHCQAACPMHRQKAEQAWCTVACAATVGNVLGRTASTLPACSFMFPGLRLPQCATPMCLPLITGNADNKILPKCSSRSQPHTLLGAGPMPSWTPMVSWSRALANTNHQAVKLQHRLKVASAHQHLLCWVSTVPSDQEAKLRKGRLPPGRLYTQVQSQV